MLVSLFRFDDDSGVAVPCGYVDDFTSLVFTRSYSGIGSWQMTISLSSQNIPFILEADIVHLRDRVTGMITKYTRSISEGNETLSVSGIELKGLVRGRIVMPPSNAAYVTYTNLSPTVIIHGLLSSQIFSANDTDRLIYGTSTFEADSRSLSYNGRFSSLEEDIEAMAETYGIGYSATINPENNIRWDVYHGKNRTDSQSDNSKMIFSYNLDNMDSSELEIATTNTNVLLVAGQGEGTQRATCLVGSGSGFRRFEAFVDARDVDDSSLLPERGNEKLSEYGDSTVFSARAPTHLNSRYGIDFDLGDVCTIRDSLLSIDARITEITECYEDGDTTLDITFGYDKSGLDDILGRIKKSTDGLKRKE